MARSFNTTKDGGSWSEETKKAVWAKGSAGSSTNPEVIRYDICNKGMYYTDYGNRNDKWGWEIDHINPVANGGTDALSNLQPLQWENNVKKGDTVNWKCSN